MKASQSLNAIALALLSILSLTLPNQVSADEPTVSPTPGREWGSLVPGLEGIESASQSLFSNGAPPNEPWIFDVVEYVFGSDNEASESFPIVCGYIAQMISDLHDNTGAKEISMGRLGDETCAYIDREEGVDVWVALRVGDSILTVFALASGGDTVAFTGDWLDEYLASFPDETDSLMPELADMPRGWSLLVTWDDITDQVRPQLQ